MTAQQMTKPGAILLAFVVSVVEQALAFAPTGKPQTPNLDKRAAQSSGALPTSERLQQLSFQVRMPWGVDPIQKSGR